METNKRLEKIRLEIERLQLNLVEISTGLVSRETDPAFKRAKALYSKGYRLWWRKDDPRDAGESNYLLLNREEVVVGNDEEVLEYFQGVGQFGLTSGVLKHLKDLSEEE